MGFCDSLYAEATTFITACYGELGKSTDETKVRLSQVRDEIERGATYRQTFGEVEHGARMAWRNSNRCIGRLFWQSLTVFDERDLQTEEQIVEALNRHIQYATNAGRIRPAITVFRQDSQQIPLRIWNHQLVRYAGYETEGGVVGDPHSLRFTRVCGDLGWTGKGTQFDVLPLVIQVGDKAPRWFSLPDGAILEVEIHHPEIPGFDELDLKWYAVPIISDMALEIGGIRYSAAPFNGWYMGSEIGARNLADAARYDKLPQVAALMGLDTETDSSLWQDKALVELNIAVLHSFKAKGVSIVDHHNAARQFEHFERAEAEAGRKCTGDWTWLIPPVSPATTHIFHRHYDNEEVKPHFFRQMSPY